MEQWLIDLLAAFPDDGNWQRRRRMMYFARWPDHAIRAAEHDAKLGNTADIDRYLSEMDAIKAAVPKL